MMYKAIILDFDGVIVESVTIKTDAFRDLFSFSPQHVEEIISFHLQNGGMSRYDKFKYIYQNVFREPLTNEKSQELSKAFSDLVVEKIIQAPYVNGAENFIKSFSGKTALYIVSATPQVELERIVRGKRIISYFKNVYGSPVTKVEHIRKIIAQTMCDPSSVLFVGDAMNDWIAARECCINFIARRNSETNETFQNVSGITKVVDDLAELTEYLGGE